MVTIIENANQITTAWLSTALNKHGASPYGKVTGVEVSKEQTAFASRIWRLHVEYSNEASAHAPKNLFLKASNPALSPGGYNTEHVQLEYTFYTSAAPLMGGGFTIPCYDAEYDVETGASHILLKDVSETHFACLDPSCNEICAQAVDSLALLHAFWWDHPRLGKDIGSFPTHEERQQEWADTEMNTNAFIKALGDRLPKPWKETYECVLPALPDLFKRHASGHNLTLAHGDAHLGNFLFPKDAGAGQAYMIDWQFWHPTIGGTDLAFMMATEWETEIRRSKEQAFLKRYHDHLLMNGVRDYPWADCWDDYRLSVILMSIFIPVWRWALFKWAPDWKALDRSMTAFADLQCDDLLGK